MTPRQPPVVAWPRPGGGWTLLASLGQRDRLNAVLDVRCRSIDPITVVIDKPVTQETLELAVFISTYQLVIIEPDRVTS